MKKYCVYKHYNAKGDLLYVGMSKHLPRRTLNHQGASVWFLEVAEIKVEWHDTQKAASLAERISIFKENPKFNKRKVNPLCDCNVKECDPWAKWIIDQGINLVARTLSCAPYTVKSWIQQGGVPLDKNRRMLVKLAKGAIKYEDFFK